MSLITVERPVIELGMLNSGRDGVIAANRALSRFFDPFYDQYKLANKRGEDIPAETEMLVNNSMYDRFGEFYGIPQDRRPESWHRVYRATIEEVLGTLRRTMFADEDRRPSLTTDIERDDGSPSSILRRLTTPNSRIDLQCKYEQACVLALSAMTADEIRADEEQDSGQVWSRINRGLTAKVFTGGVTGKTTNVDVYSYHTPVTNRLVGLSEHFPDGQYPTDLWVKKLTFPVRGMEIADPQSGSLREVRVLYDPREKSLGARVLKGFYKSLLAAEEAGNYPNGKIETIPYVRDKDGFRIVLADWSNPAQERRDRDRVAERLEDFFWGFEGTTNIVNDDSPDPRNGSTDRFLCRRMNIDIASLNRPLEVMVLTLRDHITEQFEVGTFDAKLGMHNGPAHPLYALLKMSKLAKIIWADRVYNIDHAEAKKLASYEKAASLGRKLRIHPPPYQEAA